MAVVTLFMSDSDPEKQMFKSKKEADDYDKKLALAENLSSFISQHIGDVDDALAESLGMLIADNKDRLLAALKGKPEVLFQTDEDEKLPATDKQSAETGTAAGESKEKVVSIS